MSEIIAVVNSGAYEGQTVTVWSIRLALIAYVVCLAISLFDRQGRYWKTNRFIWTAGCGLFVLHVVCAFGFVHHWSHTDAYAETAKQTAEVAGLNWGGGLYFNYLFTLIWILDTIWWWQNSPAYNRRHATWSLCLHSFFLFMAFNATVIFESGPIRWAAIAATVILVTLAIGSCGTRLWFRQRPSSS